MTAPRPSTPDPFLRLHAALATTPLAGAPAAGRLTAWLAGLPPLAAGAVARVAAAATLARLVVTVEDAARAGRWFELRADGWDEGALVACPVPLAVAAAATPEGPARTALLAWAAAHGVETCDALRRSAQAPFVELVLPLPPLASAARLAAAQAALKALGLGPFSYDVELAFNAAAPAGTGLAVTFAGAGGAAGRRAGGCVFPDPPFDLRLRLGHALKAPAVAAFDDFEDALDREPERVACLRRGAHTVLEFTWRLAG